MPTYSYRGTACNHEFDFFQKFSDDPLRECIECGGPVRRVYQPVGVVFKGSGWYINDSRKSEPGNGTKDDSDSSGKSNGKKDTGDAASPGASDAPATPAAAKSSPPAKATAD